MDAFLGHVRRLADWLNLEPAVPMTFAEPGFRQDLETPPQPFLEIYLVTEGVLRLTVKDRSHVLHAGDLALANAHFGNHGREVAGAFRYGCLSLEVPDAQQFASWTALPLLVWRRAAEPERLQHHFQEVSHVYHGAPHRWRDLLLKAAFLQLLAAAAEPAGPGDALGSLRNPHVRKAVEQMVERRADPRLSLPQLARRVGVSQSHLVRLFKTHLGHSPMRHLAEMRVRHARNLLRRSSLSIKEISYMVGFQDQLYFSRIFRRETGVSPRRYREEAG